MTDFFVYGLFDTRNPSTIFYVGQSHSLKARMSAHASDPASRAWPVVCDIRQAGAGLGCFVFASYPDRRTAMILERALILRMEGLLNPRGRLHLNLYWHPETQLDTDLYSAAILRWEVEKTKNWSERETNVFHPRKYRGRAPKVVGDEAS